MKAAGVAGPAFVERRISDTPQWKPRRVAGPAFVERRRPIPQPDRRTAAELPGPAGPAFVERWETRSSLVKLSDGVAGSAGQPALSAISRLPTTTR